MKRAPSRTTEFVLGEKKLALILHLYPKRFVITLIHSYTALYSWICDNEPTAQPEAIEMYLNDPRETEKDLEARLLIPVE